MYTLFRSIPTSQLVRKPLPALLAALLVAETFYKFHSFTLECLAFLATWFVLDALISALAGLIGNRLARAAKSR